MMIRIQDLEVPKGKMKQGYLKVSGKPAGMHQIPITIINGIDDGPVLVVNGGIHGSEYNGPAATLQLMTDLDPTSLHGAVIVVPMVNTLAFEARWYQTNPVDYRNLATTFVPETPRGGSGHPLISYRVAQTFYNDVLTKADYRIDLHSGDIFLDLTDLTNYTKFGVDPKLDEKAYALARNFGWEWIREKLPKQPPPKPEDDPMPMPPTMSTEAGGMGRCQSDMVTKVYNGFLNVMKSLFMIEGTPNIPTQAKVFNTYHMHANKGGLFISHVRAGDHVKKGEELGLIKDLFGNVLEKIIVPTDGIVVMITSPAIYEDDAVYEIGYDIRTVQ
jgi:predicted deacylase